MNRSRSLPAGLALGLAVGLAYRDTLGWIWEGWRENPYFSHGPLVPLLVGYVVWRLRPALAAAAWRTWWPGLGVVVAAGVATVVGRILDINLGLALGLWLLLHGVVLTAGGPVVYRLLLFPLCFLIFALPVSQLVIHHYSFPLQLVSARGAALLMSLLTGAAATARGTLMQMDGQDYLVAAECSGFKALLGLTMVGVLVAWLTATSPGRKAAIAALAAPIAVAANIVRLLAILVVGRLWGHDFAVTTFHDASGLVMLLAALGILMAAARLIVGPGAELAAAPLPAGDGNVRWQLAWPPLAVSALLVLLAGGLGRALVPPPPPAPRVDLASIPLRLGAYRGSDLPIDERVRRELGEVAIIQRAYTAPDGGMPHQLIVICGSGRRSLHPPAACYVGAGYQVMEEHERLLRSGSDELHFQRLIVGEGGRAGLIALYTFSDGRTTTPDYARHQRESLARGQVIWTQVHFAAAWRGSVEKTEAQLLPFVATAWPRIRGALPQGELPAPR
ncbi:MAG: exosortase/archaeosortase family protein [Fimbriimonadaceae bacterium]|nr:exosortase/archaeosortase family protein [Fimbriimonadaceae bacterium]